MNEHLVKYTCVLAILCVSCSEAVFKACTSCEGVSCPGVNDTCRHVYHDYCGCCASCAKSEGSRCGGKMNRWGSCRPDLECMYRIGSVYNEERFGFCEDLLCADMICGYRQRCHVYSREPHTGRQCVCPKYRCKGKRNPVCGYDGITYKSICHLQKTECEQGTFIGLKHKGSCPKRVVNSVPLFGDGTDHEPIGWAISSAEEINKCIFDGKVYLPGQLIDYDDPCLSVACTVSGRVLFLPIPGCGANEPEMDYKVDYGPTYIWSEWTPWTSCSEPYDQSVEQSRFRSCVEVHYEDIVQAPCPKVDNRYEYKTCNVSHDSVSK